MTQNLDNVDIENHDELGAYEKTDPLAFLFTSGPILQGSFREREREREPVLERWKEHHPTPSVPAANNNNPLSLLSQHFHPPQEKIISSENTITDIAIDPEAIQEGNILNDLGFSTEIEEAKDVFTYQTKKRIFL